MRYSSLRQQQQKDLVRLHGGRSVLAVMACAERFHAQWLRLVTLLANLGYAIPGAVVAVGLMMLFG